MLTVEHTDNGEEAVQLVRRYDFDILLLSLDLPDAGGNVLVSRTRAVGCTTPILAFTRAPHAETRVRALSAGADDVVERGIDPGELIARMRAIVRRSRGHSCSRLKAGGLTLDLGQKHVVANGVEVSLTGKECAILELLMLRKNMVLSKETFMLQLYGGLDEPEIKIIDVFVCKLRNKLAKAGMPNVINTVWGRGFTIRDPRLQDDYTPSISSPQQTPSVPAYIAA